MKSIDNRIFILLLSAIGLVVLPHASHIPLPLFVFFCFLYGWRFLTIPYKQLQPGNKSIALSTAVAVVLLVIHNQGLWGRDAGTGLFITALGLKLLETRQQRDLYLLVYLAFFVAATQFLYVQNLLMAGYIFIVCCLLLSALVFINSPRIQLRESMQLAATVIFQALPLMLVLFVFFPRLETPRWSLLKKPQSTLSGLKDFLEPGSLTDLALSEQLAFRVTFKGKIPPPEQRYWRGPVLSHTDGKRWTPVNFMPPHYQPPRPEVKGTAYHYKILLEPQKHNWVYALEMPTGFDKPLSQKSDYHLITDKAPDQRAEYELISYPEYRTVLLSPREKRGNLQLPGKPSQRIIDFVARQGGFNQTPRLFIQNILDHFQTEAFFYSLHPPLYPDKPIETFLFKDRIGFCSHYATAFVYLMRVAHIPARVVTGYQGGELNTVGNFLEIRQANAHAWAEVWLSGQGWVRVDPTAAVAPERIEQDINLEQQQATGEVNFTPIRLGKTFSWLQKARFIWRDIDYSWQRWVVNYNGKTQAGLLASLGIDNLKSWMLGLLGLIAGITLLSALLLLRKVSPDKDKTLTIYQNFCKKLTTLGLYKSASEGPLAFSRRASIQQPEMAEAIERITRLYIALRYGRYKVSRKRLYLFKKYVNRLEIKKPHE